jgi:hypothetical protein
MIRCLLHRGLSCSGVCYTGGCHDQVSSTQGVVMIRCLLHRGCHDQVSSTQGVVMIKCPLHRGRGVSCSDVFYTGGCHDQVSSTQGEGCVMIRCPLHQGVHDQMSFTPGGA